VNRHCEEQTLRDVACRLWTAFPSLTSITVSEILLHSGIYLIPLIGEGCFHTFSLPLIFRRSSMSHQRYASCIDACNTCADACNHCSVACLSEPDIARMADCIRADMDCAEACRFAAAVMARGSDFVAEVCRMCAEICERCAAMCDQHSASHCQECAKACRDCAAECRKMAA